MIAAYRFEPPITCKNGEDVLLDHVTRTYLHVRADGTPISTGKLVPYETLSNLEFAKLPGGVLLRYCPRCGMMGLPSVHGNFCTGCANAERGVNAF